MPMAPPRVCRCGAIVASGKRCEYCTAEWRRQTEERRGTAAERGYDAAWRRATAAWRAEDPLRTLCAECYRSGRLTPARITDHIRPHKGDQRLFWDRANWQTLCVRCHSIKTARDDGGFGKSLKG